MEGIYSTLKKYFGYTSFRPLQEQIIKDVLDKKDVFVLMPTGGGKSLCYQLPSLSQDGITIVVSPLISLMKDQVDGMRKNGIRAAYLNSSLSWQEQNDILKQLRNNQLSLLYVAPERLTQESFLTLLNSLTVSLFAIDEAHCISQWGHDFRPEYRKLHLLKKHFEQVPIIALTATATERVKQDIVNHLGLFSPHIYKASFNRPNLSYQAEQKQRGFLQVINFVKQRNNESGIIYCQTRDMVDDLTMILQDEGIHALSYHAGLNDIDRKDHQDRFIREDINVIVATVAFGMGIDKSNVRYILHFGLPKNLEQYYQETGRAGRDGLPSDCLLLFSFADKITIEYFIRQKENIEEQKIAKIHLQNVVHYATSGTCRRKILLNYFHEIFNIKNCKGCDNCLFPKETFDATILTQKILSCIYRTGQRFGAHHVASVLVGLKTKKVIERNHDALSTFSLLSDYSVAEVKDFIRELIERGFLQESQDRFTTLSLTKQAITVLKGKEKVFLTKREKKLFRQKQTVAQAIDTVLFNRLRLLRKTLADKENVPPYIIFSDISLQEMAMFFPQTKEQFINIKGVGEQKLELYGKFFLEEIISYAKPLGIVPKSMAPKKQKSRISVGRKQYRQKLAITLFHQGLSIEEISKQLDVVSSTVAGYLEEAYLQGEEINIVKLVAKEKQSVITDAFQKVGLDYLAPIKAMLGDNYSYDELRFMRAKLIRDKEKS